MKKKSVLVIALVICLLAIMTVGSLAYFTATKTVTNEFLTAAAGLDTDDDGKVDADELFSIRLYETTKDAEGKDVETEQGIEYTDVKPGDKLAKDPTVENTGKYDQWVRMQVTFSNAAAWVAVGGNEFDKTILDVQSGWTAVRGAVDTETDTVTFVYYLDAKLAPEGEAVLFKNVTMPANMTVDQMANLATFDITITAEAIQADNTGDTAQAAFTAHWGNN